MDPRRALIELLGAHQPEDDEEGRDLESMRRHARELADPFSSAQLPAHFTASAVVVAPDAAAVCLVHHKKLLRWLQPGGHIEPGELPAQAALREAREETGLALTLHPRCPAALDVDAHAIPARGAMPGHQHLDVRYLLLAGSRAARHDPNESLGVRWFGWDEALGLASDAALVRLLNKARRQMSPI